jgi:hypothetical protein
MAALCMATFEAAKGYFSVPANGLIDPDSYMRVVRIRDGLGGGWFTSVVASDNAGHGTVVYWSHLLDGLILALRAPLLLVTDRQSALLLGAALTGPLLAGCLAASLVWAPAPLIMQQPRWRWLWTAPLAALLAPALSTYGMFGYVHYHLPLVLIALLAAACGGRAATGNATASAWCGALAAADIWLSPEALPYVLMAMGVVGVAWCQNPTGMTRALRTCFMSFLIVILAALLIDPPFEGRFAPVVDRISIAYAVLALMLCALAWLSASINAIARTVWTRCASYGAVSVATLGLWLTLFPNILHGLSGLIPAEDVAAYFGVIDEMKALPHTLGGALMIAPSVLSILAAVIISWQRQSLLWAYAALCGAGVVILAFQYIRFLGYAEAMAAAMLPVALDAIGSSRLQPALQSLSRQSAIATFLLLPILPTAAPAKPATSGAGAPCSVRDILPALQAATSQVVLTEIADTPEILWLSHVHTVGSLYHRSIAAFMEARNAWRSPPSSTVPEAIRATDASYILACDSTGRTALTSDLPPDTLQDRLNHHDVPSWLHAIGHAGGYTLYRIDR